MKPRELVLTAFFAALTVLCAAISIPIPVSPVPFTLAMVAVFLSGALLPPKQAVFSQIIYLLLGIIGLPVFSEMRGGLGMIAGPTGGYLIAYPIMAFLISWIMQKAKKRTVPLLFVSMVCALAVLYLLGSFWLSIVAQMSFSAALSAGALPFMIPDLIKAFLASLLAVALSKALARRGLSDTK